MHRRGQHETEVLTSSRPGDSSRCTSIHLNIIPEKCWTRHFFIERLGDSSKCTLLNCLLKISRCSGKQLVTRRLGDSSECTSVSSNLNMTKCSLGRKNIASGLGDSSKRTASIRLRTEALNETMTACCVELDGPGCSSRCTAGDSMRLRSNASAVLIPSTSNIL